MSKSTTAKGENPTLSSEASQKYVYIKKYTPKQEQMELLYYSNVSLKPQDPGVPTIPLQEFPQGGLGRAPEPNSEAPCKPSSRG